LADDPDAWSRSPSELIQVAAEAPRTEQGSAPPGTLHGHVFARGALQPDGLAIISSRRTLDYAESLGRARAAAAWLRAAGARANQLVAVVMDKGWEQVVAALAIDAAGA